jgi:hypothetical protein
MQNTVTPLKKYNSLYDMKKQNNACEPMINKLHDAIRNPNKATEMLALFYNTPTDITTYKNCNIAWVHLAVCKIFGLRYTDSSRMTVAIATVTDILRVLPGSSLKATLSTSGTSGTNPSFTMDDIKRVQEVGMELNKLVDDLNNSRLYPLTLANLGGSTMQGGASLESVNYGAVANMIKHNNNMLLAYGLSSQNVREYTTEMHGGRQWNIRVDPNEDRTSEDLSENGIVNTQINSEHIGAIVKTINDQIKALNSKEKQLSANSKEKVKTVIDGLIKAENEVSLLLENLTAVNAYPPTDKEVNVETPGTALENLKEAIKEKTRKELKALAVSEGLGRALADAIGYGFKYASGDESVGNLIV